MENAKTWYEFDRIKLFLRKIIYCLDLSFSCIECVCPMLIPLDAKKSSTYDSMPVTILKQFVNAYLPHLTNSINYSIRQSSFPQELKLSEVIPVYKKLDPLQKENYRPISLLPQVSKVFERIIHKQITNYKITWDTKFFSCDVRKMEKGT